MPGGRPSIYDPSFCDQLISHMSQGLSFETFGAVIKVSKDTLYRWVKEHEEFSDAKKEGSLASQILWEKLGLVACAGQGITNTGVWIFNMKNRFGWRDKQDIDISTVQPTIIKRLNGDQYELGLTEGRDDDADE